MLFAVRRRGIGSGVTRATTTSGSSVSARMVSAPPFSEDFRNDALSPFRIFEMARRHLVVVAANEAGVLLAIGQCCIGLCCTHAHTIYGRYAQTMVGGALVAVASTAH